MKTTQHGDYTVFEFDSGRPPELVDSHNDHVIAGADMGEFGDVWIYDESDGKGFSRIPRGAFQAFIEAYQRWVDRGGGVAKEVLTSRLG